MDYDVIIGLEIHAELKTKSKMFCACDNDSLGKEANSCVCPVCLGHPGTLPVPNKAAIEWTIMTGLALNCQINRISKFDRKNYFYPDLPKGYQISQYDLPLAYNGYLEIDGDKIEITRIHLEEDTGKSMHNRDHTLLDFNRAGTPLMELVTEPVMKNAAQAKSFCQSYQQILRYLGVANANMEKGELRCEANVSLQKPGGWEYRDGQILAIGKNKLNPKVEVKNINSFRALEKAINFEIVRQSEALKNHKIIIAETRGWDDNKNMTVSQRIKETSADYRYFPEPDIPLLKISDTEIEKLQADLPELPIAKKKRFLSEYGLDPKMVEVLITDKKIAAWTEEVISELKAWTETRGDDIAGQDKRLARLAANWISGEILKILNAQEESDIRKLKITPEDMAELICLIYEGRINSSTGQKVLSIMAESGRDPEEIVKEQGLEQSHDQDEIKNAATKVIANYPDQVNEYLKGKTNIIQFLIGKVMAETQGRANPQIAKEALEHFLNKPPKL
ncbi:MAG: Asp-tRNA(Asn)/Glu-tRNA(Gln) amidotransferase subunit GatB [Patescibacteria group bacterium]